MKSPRTRAVADHHATTSPAVVFLLLVPPCLRVRTTNYLVRQLKYAYLATEALTDHPLALLSMAHGYFPLFSSCDGCNKLAATNLTLERYLAQRQKQGIGINLGAV